MPKIMPMDESPSSCGKESCGEDRSQDESEHEGTEHSELRKRNYLIDGVSNLSEHPDSLPQDQPEHTFDQ